MEFDLEAILLIVTGVVTVASGIAALTPNKKDDVVVSRIMKIVNILALNVKNAKPEEKNV